jgi:two-component sensor histidine kinase
MRALPLTALLSLMALCASVVRTLAAAPFVQAMTMRTLVLVETGNWLSWTIWGALLSRAIRPVAARERFDAKAIAMLAGLAIAPMIAVPVIASPWHWVVSQSQSIVHSAGHIAGHNLPTNLLLGVLMLGVAQGFAGLERARRLERTAAELRTRLAESQLDTLRAQLDPHFLFNALNSISVLARRGDNTQVVQMITRLSGLLRHSLESARTQLVPLRVELEALRHYVEIEQIRFGDRLMVEWDIPRELHDRTVPSFVLQPIVENAIRHGFVDATRPLQLVLVAKSGHQPGGAGDEALTLIVHDDGAGVSAGDATREGVGLGNTRARLAALYGGAASLAIESGEGGRGTRVTIVIPPAPAKGAA